MKKCWKRLALALALLLVLAGCSAGAPKYPELPAADTEGVVLESVATDTFKFCYPGESWVQAEAAGQLAVIYVGDDGEDGQCNFNVQLSAAYEGKLADKDREELMAALDAYDGYITVDLSELRLLKGEPVIYMETTMQFTDAYLDLMVEEGVFTEEYIAELGGRELFLSLPPTHQVMIYASVDGGLFLYTGTYYNQAQKDALLRALTVVIPNTERV